MTGRSGAGAGLTEPLQVQASVEGRSVCLALRGEPAYGTVALLDESVARVFGPPDGTPWPRLTAAVLGAEVGLQRRAHDRCSVPC